MRVPLRLPIYLGLVFAACASLVLWRMRRLEAVPVSTEVLVFWLFFSLAAAEKRTMTAL